MGNYTGWAQCRIAEGLSRELANTRQHPISNCTFTWLWVKCSREIHRPPELAAVRAMEGTLTGTSTSRYAAMGRLPQWAG